MFESENSLESCRPIANTVKPRPEAHMDMIFFEVFLKSIDLIPQNRYYNGTIYIIDNVIVLSDLVESSGYSSKTLQKGSCPYAPLDEALRYGIVVFSHCDSLVDLILVTHCNVSTITYYIFMRLKRPIDHIRYIGFPPHT